MTKKKSKKQGTRKRLKWLEYQVLQLEELVEDLSSKLGDRLEEEEAEE